MSAAAHFLSQAAACERLDAPFTARLMRLCAERLGPEGAVGRRIHDWSGPSTDAVALRLAGALHGLVLSGAEPRLAAVYAAPETVSDASLWAVVEAAIAAHEAEILDWLDYAPQTNEVARAAVLIAAGRWLGGPLVLSELGASAGLNLLWEHYALEVGGRRFGPNDAAVTLRPRWTGPLPRAGAPEIRARASVDLAPLDPVDDRLRMRAYVWPDHDARRARLEAALTLAQRERPVVERGDAVDWLAERLATPYAGATHLVYHTIAWQYLPPEAQARGAALLAKAGARASETAPLAHLSMEGDGGEGAALTLTRWPGGETIPMGRADFHGRWIAWHPPEG